MKSTAITKGKRRSRIIPALLTDVNVQNGFINDQNVQATCDARHRAIRRGD